jgi:hypothetical protein
MMSIVDRQGEAVSRSYSCTKQDQVQLTETAICWRDSGHQVISEAQLAVVLFRFVHPCLIVAYKAQTLWPQSAESNDSQF